MSILVVILLYVLAPGVPAMLIVASVGGSIDAYTVSLILGISAFTLFCNQLILASRPGFLVSTLGLKRVISMHSATPALALVLALAHAALKLTSGFSLGSSQALLGLTALIVFTMASVSAFMLLANVKPPLGTRLKAFRVWAAAKLHLDYRRSRAFHSVTVAALVVVAVHVALASSAALSTIPAGSAWLAAHLALSLGLYLGYRLRGRKTTAAS